MPRRAAACLGRPKADLPDAVFCANDLLAIGVVQTLAMSAVSVPGDLAVVGYDDIEFAQSTVIPITSVRTPDYELGTAATDLLFQEIARVRAHEDSPERAEHVVFAPELVVRASTGPPAG